MIGAGQALGVHPFILLFFFHQVLDEVHPVHVFRITPEVDYHAFRRCDLVHLPFHLFPGQARGST